MPVGGTTTNLIGDFTLNVDDLNKMTVKQLLALPEASEIKGRHKMRKDALIAALVALAPVVVEETPAEAAEDDVIILSGRPESPEVIPMPAMSPDGDGDDDDDRTHPHKQRSKRKRDAVKEKRKRKLAARSRKVNRQKKKHKKAA